jgi:hypothetical protein
MDLGAPAQHYQLVAAALMSLRAGPHDADDAHGR